MCNNRSRSSDPQYDSPVARHTRAHLLRGVLDVDVSVVSDLPVAAAFDPWERHLQVAPSQPWSLFSAVVLDVAAVLGGVTSLASLRGLALPLSARRRVGGNALVVPHHGLRALPGGVG